MIKYFIFCLTGMLLISCGNSDEGTLEAFLTLEVNANDKWSENYTFTDLNIRVYGNKSDWIDESNELFSGNFDETGKINLTNIGLIPEQEVYVDVFTTDNVWSNWGDNLFETGTYFINLHSTAVIGVWDFSFIRNQINNMPENMPKSFTISKDLKLNMTFENNEIQRFLITSVYENGMDIKMDECSPVFYAYEGIVIYNDETEELYLPILSGDPGTEYVFKEK